MTACSPSPIRPAKAVLARFACLAATVVVGAFVMVGPATAAQLSQAQQLREQGLPPDATGRTDQRFREAPTPPSGAGPQLQVEPLPPEEVPENAANIPLQIEAVTLVGVTVYKPEELEEYWRDRIGKPGKLGDLFAIAAEITARYRNDGYVLSRAVVPAQEIEDGKVEIRVVEGYVAQVIFEGDDDRPDLLRGIGERITDARPVRVADLERYLLVLNDQPGVAVSSILKPSPDQTGAAVLVVTVQREALQSFATLDDRGTRYVGPIQTTIGTRINSPFGLGDQTFIRGITTPLFPNELMAFDLNNQQTLNAEGTTLALNLNFGEAHPGFTLQPFKLTSDSSTIAFVLSHPLIRSRVENLRVNVQAAANQYRTDIGSSTTPLLRDSIRSLRISLIYESVDRFHGANLAGLQFSQGLDVFGASKPGATFLSRAAGRPDYTKLNYDLSRAQSLGGGFTLITAATAQTAFTSLLSSEQFGLGGSTFLRAYDPSDLIGDSGIAAKFEIQYSDQPKEWYLKSYDLYSYFDLGRTQNLTTLPGEKSSDAGISLGVGSRFTLTDWSNGYVEVSQPIMRGVPTEGTHDHFPRVFFALIAKF
jgi:hemolysin activation/secretion protein